MSDGFDVTFQDEPLALGARPDPSAPGCFVVTVGDVQHRVTARLDGEGRMTVVYMDGPHAGRRFQAVTSREAGGGRWATAAGVTVRVAPHQPGSGATGGAGSGTLEAPMPGKVAKLLCAEGDTVTAGTTLVVVEAMKMEHALAAPFDGTVARVACTEGAMVQPGAALVVVAPQDGEEADETP